MNDSNFILIYTSRATEEVNSELLNDILNTAREENKKSNITGFLVERNGYFLQLLEGPEESVRALYKKISQDPRHSLITLQGESYSEKRMIPDWSMGRVILDEADSVVNNLLTLFELARSGKPFTDTKVLMLLLKKFARNAELIE